MPDALRCLARAIGATNTTPVPAGAELFPKVNEPIELLRGVCKLSQALRAVVVEPRETDARAGVQSSKLWA
jgi:hypothetical protein